MPIVAMVVSAVAFAGLAIMVVRMRSRRTAEAVLATARAEAAALVKSEKLAAAAHRRAFETRAREEGLVARAEAEAELVRTEAARGERERVVNQRLAAAQELHADLDARHGVIDERMDAVKSVRDRARSLLEDAEQREQEALTKLEERSGRSSDAVRDSLSRRWIEDAQAEAAARIRAVEQGLTDASHDETARRLMEISVARYRNHFLTERAISKLILAPDVLELLSKSDGLLHKSIEEVANVQMHVDDSGEFLRLEGLDGVGREVARRAISRLMKKDDARGPAERDPIAWTRDIRVKLDREILSLGKRAFTVLDIARPHQEIVQLVGALNYRTSYTQNQWLHAVEASFLCGMIAEELGLDVKLARRATLMHDIGKALTHQIDGSHAVIGADIARRLGEDELVANAIGAHHLDEPMNSAYAFLVAAADAMSGARPGARREFADGYTNRLADLERIGASFRGVDRAFAVHGGRELRVYVHEGNVSDLEAVELSAEIAGQVTEEMTFPGQIKVTVIRAFEAVATAN